MMGSKTDSGKILGTQEEQKMYLAKIKKIQEINEKNKNNFDAFYKEFYVNNDGAARSSEVKMAAINEDNFDKKEDAYLLAVADNLDLEQAAERRQNRKVNNLPATQGFRKLEEFATSEELKECANYPATIESFEEDELNATLYTTAVVAEQLTPKKCTKSIVEQILEDFCSSPQTPRSAALEESLKLQSPSPTFKFRHQIIRTYSRQSKLNYRKRRNLTQQLNGNTILDHGVGVDDDNNDDCMSTSSGSSGLSVQQDLTKIQVERAVIEEEEIPHSETCALNESQKLYENLLNLSEYFSQNSDEVENAAQSELQNTEITIKNPCIDLMEEDELKGKLESQIMYDISSQADVELHKQRISQHFNDRQLDMQLEVSQLSEEANEILSEIINFRKKNPVDLIHLTKVAKMPEENFLGFEENPNPMNEEAQIFSDDECDDFFLNFKTQEVLAKTPTEEVFNNNSLSQLAGKDMPGFHTASKKLIEISEKAKKKAINILAEITDLGDLDGIASSSNKFPIFSTASMKPIEISEEAKKKAENILAELPELPDLNSIASSSNKLPTFSTASKKPIAVSEKAKKKAENILAELPELPGDIAGKVGLERKDKTGFSSASSKSIALSVETSEVLKIGAELQLQAVVQPETVRASEVKITNELQDYADMQFSEWPYGEKLETEQEPLPMLELERSNISIVENNNNNHGKELQASNVSLDSSLNISNKNVIYRKNLLSLSKRRKHKNITPSNSTTLITPETKNKPVLENNADKTLDDKTPSKTKSKENIASEGCMESPSTAITYKEQLKEHLLTSSTPLSFASSSHNNSTPETPVNNSTVNSTHKKNGSKNSTVVQRLERLAMYGEPPALSPIPQATPKITNNCKSLGLGRNLKRVKK